MDKNNIYSPDGVIIIDNNSKIIAFNEAARRITGYKEDDVSLKNYSFLFERTDSARNRPKNAIDRK